MVATISTRGSSEGLLAVMVIALLWAITRKKVVLAAVLLGLSVHFKIYPFIYATSIVWWMDEKNLGLEKRKGGTWVRRFCNMERVRFGGISLGVFMGLNLVMYSLYVSSIFPPLSYISQNIIKSMTQKEKKNS